MVKFATPQNLTSPAFSERLKFSSKDLKVIVLCYPTPDFATAEAVGSVGLVIPSNECPPLRSNDLPQDYRDLWTNLRLACCVRGDYDFLVCHIERCLNAR